MVHRTTVLNCPHCGKQLLSRYDNGGIKYTYINNPFEICPHCGKTYVLSEAKEWINLTQEERDNYLSFRGSAYPNNNSMFGAFAALDIALIIASIACSATGAWHGMWIPASILFVILFFYIFTKKRKINRMMKNKSYLYDDLIKQSISRCNEPDHIIALVNFGFKIIPLSAEELKANNIPYFNDYINKILAKKETNKEIKHKKNTKHDINTIIS